MGASIMHIKWVLRAFMRQPTIPIYLHTVLVASPVMVGLSDSQVDSSATAVASPVSQNIFTYTQPPENGGVLRGSTYSDSAEQSIAPAF